MGRYVRSSSVGLAVCFVKARMGSRTADRQRNRHKAGGANQVNQGGSVNRKEGKKKREGGKGGKKGGTCSYTGAWWKFRSISANFQTTFLLCLSSRSWAVGWAGSSMKILGLLSNVALSVWGPFPPQALSDHPFCISWMLAAPPSWGLRTYYLSPEENIDKIWKCKACKIRSQKESILPTVSLAVLWCSRAALSPPSSPCSPGRSFSHSNWWATTKHLR